MKYTEVNPFTGKNIDEDAPANATKYLSITNENIIMSL